jgi:hypothetical protein
MELSRIYLTAIAVLVTCGAALPVRGEEPKVLSLETLLGKYEGRIQTHNQRQTEMSFQTEIVSVDSQARTVTLVNTCSECEFKEVKKKDCPVSEAKETIKFSCKGKFGDELYQFNGERLKATGVGSKYPYTISVTKNKK